MNSKKFLIIRRDNIGDLVCTTPLIHALRKAFPEARIDALVNSYNEAVLANNPDLNHVYAYTKAKHRDAGETAFGVYWRRIRLLLDLRRLHYDYVVLANRKYLPKLRQLARWIAPKNVISFVPDGKRVASIQLPVSMARVETLHEVEVIFRLLKPLGIGGVPPKLQVFASEEKVLAVFNQLGMRQDVPSSEFRVPSSEFRVPSSEFIAIHISARKTLQRWPAEYFAALIRALHSEGNYQFLLLWSPGSASNPHHPGDDEKAAQIIAATKGLPVFAYLTSALGELIAALSICQAMVCSDGGAMHIGAGLGLPIVCLFGNSDARCWHPWSAPYELLQKPSEVVSDISVDDVLSAFRRLKVKAAF